MKHHGLGRRGTIYCALAACLTFGLLFPLPRTVAAADTPTVAQQLEALSTEFYAFNMPEFLSSNNRLEMGTTEATARNTTWDAEQKKYEAWIAKLLTIEADKETLRLLLKHPNPKVRTLAMALLINANDPRVLPDIADLLDDDAVTFFGPSIKHQIDPPGGSPLAKEATVGSNARSVMWFYVHPANFTSDYQDVMIIPQSSRIPFDKYWSTHKDVKYCTSWFTAKIHHKPRHSISSYPDYQNHLRNVHTEIDQLPEPDRTWILLALSFDSYTGPITSKEELIPLIQKLGADTIMEILRTRHISSSDPDIKSNAGRQRQMVGFLFKNADSLTRPSDADDVRKYLAQFEKEDPYPRSSHIKLPVGGKGNDTGKYIKSNAPPPPIEQQGLPSQINFTLEPNIPTPPETSGEVGKN